MTERANQYKIVDDVKVRPLSSVKMRERLSVLQRRIDYLSANIARAGREGGYECQERAALVWAVYELKRGILPKQIGYERLLVRVKGKPRPAHTEGEVCNLMQK